MREFMSPRQASRELGVSTRTLLRWIEDGQLRLAFKTAGGHARFDRQEVEALKGTQLNRAPLYPDETDTEVVEASTERALVIQKSNDSRGAPSPLLISRIERANADVKKYAKAHRELASLHDQAVRDWLGVERNDLRVALWIYQPSSVAAAIGAPVAQLLLVCNQHEIRIPPAEYWHNRTEF